MKDDNEGDVPTATYEPPTIVRLGTLTELTQGGVIGPDDMMGGAGDEGSV